MRLSRPLYEGMPLFYSAVGGLGFMVAFLDPGGPRTMIAFSIGVAMEIAALTVFLRRQDCRARSREYTGESLELPALHGASRSNG